MPAAPITRAALPHPCARPAELAASQRRDETAGMLLGLAGVAIFSLSLPATRLAVAEMNPVFAALGRAVAAALPATLWLLYSGAPRPRRADLPGLALVAFGCVAGYPLLSSIALQTMAASHGAVLGSILPLITALFAALRGGERPSPGFWALALAGTALVAGFALRQGGGQLHAEDWLMLVAILLAALGYQEGARLARHLGGLEVISWALVLSAPVLAPLVLWLGWRDAPQLSQASLSAWLGFAYISLGTMFLGFVFWYRGLARGGVARVSQVQLLQPFLGLLGAALLVGEPLTWANAIVALGVLAIVALGRRMPVQRRAPAAAPAFAGGQAGAQHVQ
jgi:drug/metabolite transporter (DMT)-like permease